MTTRIRQVILREQKKSKKRVIKRAGSNGYDISNSVSFKNAVRPEQKKNENVKTKKVINFYSAPEFPPVDVSEITERRVIKSCACGR